MAKKINYSVVVTVVSAVMLIAVLSIALLKSAETRKVEPRYLFSESEAENIIRKEAQDVLIWYQPVDTESINITLKEDEGYITYHTDIPQAQWEKVVNLLRNGDGVSMKEGYTFPDGEYAIYLIINESKYGLQMVVWNEIPDGEDVNIAIDQEEGAPESYKTRIPGSEWNRVKGLILAR